MPTHSLRGSLFVAASLIAPLCAQTGRAVSVGQPARIGATARFDVAYPSAAIGNLGMFAITEHATGTTPFAVPGFQSFGAVRIAPLQVLVTSLFLPDASGTASMSLGIPLAPALVGFPIDAQTVDIHLVGNVFH